MKHTTSTVTASGTGVVLAVNGMLDLIGLGSIADQYGTYPTLIGAVSVFAVIAIGFIGGKSWLSRAKEASQKQITGEVRDKIDEDEDGTGLSEEISDKNDDVLNEATERLEREGKEITGANISEVLEEIEKEQEDNDNESPTGLLYEEGDRSPVARMSVAPTSVEENEDYLKIRNHDGEEFMVRTMIVSSYPDRVSYGWLDKLFTSGLDADGADVRTTYHIWPRDPDTMMSKLNQQATRLTASIRQKQKEGKINTMEEEQKRGKVNQLRDRLSKGATKIFHEIGRAHV